LYFEGGTQRAARKKKEDTRERKTGKEGLKLEPWEGGTKKRPDILLFEGAERSSKKSLKSS